MCGCVVAPGGGWGMCGCFGGHAWLLSGGHTWLLCGACVVARGARVVGQGGHAWLLPGGERVWDTTRYRDTINERAIRILLECILVVSKLTGNSDDLGGNMFALTEFLF